MEWNEEEARADKSEGRSAWASSLEWTGGWGKA